MPITKFSSTSLPASWNSAALGVYLGQGVKVAVPSTASPLMSGVLEERGGSRARESHIVLLPSDRPSVAIGSVSAGDVFSFVFLCFVLVAIINHRFQPIKLMHPSGPFRATWRFSDSRTLAFGVIPADRLPPFLPPSCSSFLILPSNSLDSGGVQRRRCGQQVREMCAH